MKKSGQLLLDVKNFGLAAGILWGVSLFILTHISLSTGYAEGFLNLMVGVYPGYELSTSGSVAGLLFGFLDGFIGCVIFAWLYNWLCTRK